MYTEWTHWQCVWQLLLTNSAVHNNCLCALGALASLALIDGGRTSANCSSEELTRSPAREQWRSVRDTAISADVNSRLISSTVNPFHWWPVRIRIFARGKAYGCLNPLGNWNVRGSTRARVRATDPQTPLRRMYGAEMDMGWVGSKFWQIIWVGLSWIGQAQPRKFYYGRFHRLGLTLQLASLWLRDNRGLSPACVPSSSVNLTMHLTCDLTSFR